MPLEVLHIYVVENIFFALCIPCAAKSRLKFLDHIVLIHEYDGDDDIKML